MQHIIFT